MGVIKKILLLFLFPLFVFSQVTSENLPQSYTIDTLIHEVKRKQTLYSISKIYEVSVQDLRTFNPQIKGNKLSRKMQLNIPQKRKLISIEDKLYNNDDVRHVMYEKRASDPQLTVSLKADQAARMEIISDIHNELRKADALKLNYSTKVKAPN